MASLLDVGSNTCWASAAFARRGLDVVALSRDKRAMTEQSRRTRDAERHAGRFPSPPAGGS